MVFEVPDDATVSLGLLICGIDLSASLTDGAASEPALTRKVVRGFGVGMSSRLLSPPRGFSVLETDFAGLDASAAEPTADAPGAVKLAAGCSLMGGCIVPSYVFKAVVGLPATEEGDSLVTDAEEEAVEAEADVREGRLLLGREDAVVSVLCVLLMVAVDVGVEMALVVRLYRGGNFFVGV